MSSGVVTCRQPGLQAGAAIDAADEGIRAQARHVAVATLPEFGAQSGHQLDAFLLVILGACQMAGRADFCRASDMAAFLSIEKSCQ